MTERRDLEFPRFSGDTLMIVRAENGFAVHDMTPARMHSCSRLLVAGSAAELGEIVVRLMDRPPLTDDQAAALVAALVSGPL